MASEAGERGHFFHVLLISMNGGRKFKVESSVWTIMGAEPLKKKAQLGITFLRENLNFLWADDEGPSHDGITALHTNWASTSGRENSSPTVALYSQRLHTSFTQENQWSNHGFHSSSKTLQNLYDNHFYCIVLMLLLHLYSIHLPLRTH